MAGPGGVGSRVCACVLWLGGTGGGGGDCDAEGMRSAHPRRMPGTAPRAPAPAAEGCHRTWTTQLALLLGLFQATRMELGDWATADGWRTGLGVHTGAPGSVTWVLRTGPMPASLWALTSNM